MPDRLLHRTKLFVAQHGYHQIIVRASPPLRYHIVDLNDKTGVKEADPDILSLKDPSRLFNSAAHPGCARTRSA